MDSKKGLMQQRNRKRKTCIWLLLWVLRDRTSKKYKFSIGTMYVCTRTFETWVAEWCKLCNDNDAIHSIT